MGTSVWRKRVWIVPRLRSCWESWSIPANDTFMHIYWTNRTTKVLYRIFQTTKAFNSEPRWTLLKIDSKLRGRWTLERKRVTPRPLRKHTKQFAPSGTDSALSVKTTRTGEVWLRAYLWHLLVRASNNYVYGRPTGTGTGVQQEQEWTFVRAFNGNFTMTRTVVAQWATHLGQSLADSGWLCFDVGLLVWSSYVLVHTLVAGCRCCPVFSLSPMPVSMLLVPYSRTVSIVTWKESVLML